MYIDTELVLPMCNVHPYFSLKNLDQKVCIIHGKIWDSQRHMHPSVHCSIIRSGQHMETTKVCFDRRRDKDVVHVHYGILLSHEKRWNTATCDNVGGP